MLTVWAFSWCLWLLVLSLSHSVCLSLSLCGCSVQWPTTSLLFTATIQTHTHTLILSSVSLSVPPDDLIASSEWIWALCLCVFTLTYHTRNIHMLMRNIHFWRGRGLEGVGGSPGGREKKKNRPWHLFCADELLNRFSQTRSFFLSLLLSLFLSLFFLLISFFFFWQTHVLMPGLIVCFGNYFLPSTVGSCCRSLDVMLKGTSKIINNTY